MKILDGKLVAQNVTNEIKERIKSNNYNLTLAVILVGNNEASKVYVNAKKKACENADINFHLYHLLDSTTEEDIIKLINELNDNSNINGILLQSPVPEGIDYNKCISYINKDKDVDGLGIHNVYNNYMNNNDVLPCTVKGIIKLMEYYNIDPNGKNIVIIGRSNLVGKPLSLVLSNMGATVTVCHSKTKDISLYTTSADIVISAAGKINLVNEDMVKENVTIIDVGINKVNNKLYGDVDFENVSKKSEYITPVPGGVGPMTVAMVLSNCLELYERNL